MNDSYITRCQFVREKVFRDFFRDSVESNFFIIVFWKIRKNELKVFQLTSENAFFFLNLSYVTNLFLYSSKTGNLIFSEIERHPWYEMGWLFAFYGHNPAGIYLLKANNRHNRTKCEIYEKLTIKTSERRQWLRSYIFIVNFEHILHFVLVFLLVTLNM